MQKTYDLHILAEIPLVTPKTLKGKHPMVDQSNKTVIASRQVIKNILEKQDGRLLAIVGPCSIHDYSAAVDYASRLNELREKLQERLYVVMRVYFEKPRTTLGWRGLIIDPHIDGTNDISEGLTIARKLLLEITSMGLPVATEMLDPYVPQYIDDLISWAAIGARTTESQTHRNMASGLSMPVGFKNSTDGNLQIAIDAMSSAQSQHSFLGIDKNGKTCILKTSGNPYTHIILRGGRNQPNFRQRDIDFADQLLTKGGFQSAIMIDCSHGNSGKNPFKQADVLKSILRSRRKGYKNIIGFMLESNLREGKQEIPEDLNQLAYGLSITDACIGWEQTEELLFFAFDSMI